MTSQDITLSAHTKGFFPGLYQRGCDLIVFFYPSPTNTITTIYNIVSLELDLDLSAAFDTVDHTFLIDHLKTSDSVNETALSFIFNFKK